MTVLLDIQMDNLTYEFEIWELDLIKDAGEGITFQILPTRMNRRFLPGQLARDMIT